jgi:hypothetical protein
MQYDRPKLHLEHPSVRRDTSPYPYFVSMDTLPLEVTKWRNIGPPLRLLSSFDDLIIFYTNTKHKATNNPVTAMHVCQRYVRYKWAGYLRSRLDEYWKLHDTLYFKSYSSCDINTWFHSWDLKWRTETFRRLSFGRATIELVSEDILHNMKALGLGSAGSTLEESDVEGWESLWDMGSYLWQRHNSLIEVYV